MQGMQCEDEREAAEGLMMLPGRPGPFGRRLLSEDEVWCEDIMPRGFAGTGIPLLKGGLDGAGRFFVPAGECDCEVFSLGHVFQYEAHKRGACVRCSFHGQWWGDAASRVWKKELPGALKTAKDSGSRKRLREQLGDAEGEYGCSQLFSQPKGVPVYEVSAWPSVSATIKSLPCIGARVDKCERECQKKQKK
jgi:hypothetical protein